MDHDINTSAALAVLFEFVHHGYLQDSRNGLTGGDAKAAAEFVREVDSVFNILPESEELLDDAIAEQIEARQAARRRRDFAEADRIRDRLASKGIQLEDNLTQSPCDSCVVY